MPGGINPYMAMLMQRGGMPQAMGMRLPAGMQGPAPQAPVPSIPGWAQRQEGQAGPSPPQRPATPPGGQVSQGQQGGQQAGGMGAYQRMIKGARAISRPAIQTMISASRWLCR
jgi:hypothetical protein